MKTMTTSLDLPLLSKVNIQVIEGSDANGVEEATHFFHYYFMCKGIFIFFHYSYIIFMCKVLEGGLYFLKKNLKFKHLQKI
jgi:hypothetical protein